MTLTATQIPTKTEVNLQRLLAVCEERASKENGLIRGPEKMKYNIKYLRKLLEQIEKEAEEVDKTAISEYERKIQRLSDIVDEFKLISPVTRTFSQARFIKHAHQSQEDKNKENQLELKMVRQAEKELKEELMQRPKMFDRIPKKDWLFSSDNSGSDVRQRRPIFDQEDTSNIETVLRHHRKTQDELTNDLVKMVERLKMNSVIFGDILTKDEKVIDEAQNTLGKWRNFAHPNKRTKIAHNSDGAASTIENTRVLRSDALREDDDLRHKKSTANPNRSDSSAEKSSIESNQLDMHETKILKVPVVEENGKQSVDENHVFEDWMEGWEDFDFTDWNENRDEVNRAELERGQSFGDVRKLEVFQTQLGHYFSHGIKKNEKVVTLINENGDFCYLHLRDDWLETSICDGNTVNVFGKFDDDNKCIVDNSQGLVIVRPDVLISATSVADSFTCMRKGILSDRVNGNFFYNSALTYGSLFHELIQACLVNENFTDSFIESEAEKLTKQSIEKLYSADLNEEEVIRELIGEIPKIQAWAGRFIGDTPKPIEEHLSTSNVKPAICISKVMDIEEHICSTTYGLKGKIDASVEVKLSENGVSKKLIMPFELKTSRNVSSSHFAQTVFYCLLMSDHYDIDVGSGLLYYLKSQDEETGKMIKVPVVPHELRSLMIQRNRVAWFASDAQFSSLPPMINNKFQCGNCASNTSCFLYHKAIEKGSGAGDIRDLFDHIVSHLQDHHLDFYRKWDELISLEEEDLYRFQPEIWNMLSTKCDDDLCLSNMRLDPDSINIIPNGEGNKRFKCKFVNQMGRANFVLDTQFCVGDHVIVSSEREHRTVASGFVENIAPNYIWLTLDRIPRNGPKCKVDLEIESCHGHLELCENTSAGNYLEMDVHETLYRIDKDELASNMRLVRQNLVSLLVDEETARLRKLVVDFVPPRFGRANEKLSDHEDMKNLNEDQRKAVKLALNAEDYAIILGMPGTGKSTTIVQIIKSLVRDGKSVLLAAYTHSAVDNILSKLVREDIDVLRIGTKAKVRPDIWPFLLDMENFDSVNLFRSFLESKQRRFDYCIIDEATQVTLPICVGPLRFASRFLLVGDDFQLPPLVRNREAIEKGMDKSLFTTLTEKHTRAFTKLRYQYRMNEDIMNLSNCLIYDYKMLCGSPAGPSHYLSIPKWNDNFLSRFHRDWDSNDDNRCNVECWLRMVLDPKKPVVMIDTDNLEANETRGLNQNIIEASLVEQCVKAMVVGGVHRKEIGIITPFRHQIKLLTQKFKDLPDIEISTVDRFQGREKEVIVMSLVKANTDYKVSDILKDYRRLNVAITRARSKLIIFGSKSTVSASELMRHIIDHIESAQMVYKLDDKNAPHLHVIPKIDVSPEVIEKKSKVDKQLPRQHKNAGIPGVLLRNNQLLRDITIDLNPT
ncbi:4873_t:CDS:10 [Acaulospora colombiana]|uniref:4873_t:CDS:1 n=1 Tax=Acaulospora colombiana TaxID=27376 RepID=A0ACA9K7W3_9GLOM|nr:4873_t:CDS:10 [Acaulospora colombiana]